MFEPDSSLWCYDLYPKIVPVGRPVNFTLRVLDPDLLYKAVTHIDVLAINGADVKVSIPPLFEKVPTTSLPAPEQGFCFTLTLPSEQEYKVRIVYDEGGVKHPAVTLSFYALQDDLLMKKPLVGDFHGHTFFSDGSQGPAFVAAHYRLNGYDFCTITDHRRMQPSFRAINAFKGLDIPFRVYNGEEVHAKDSYVHIVNFASDKSANEFALADHTEEGWRDHVSTPEWDEELQKVADSLDDLPEGVNRLEAARCTLISRIIREGGGMSILAHPHWTCPVRNAPDQMHEYFWKHNTFDAFELVGGMSWYDNNTQINLYEEWRARGLQVPVVGDSDEHGVLTVNEKKPVWFTEERTVVFAEENSREAIIKAVKGLYTSVILKYVDQYPMVFGGGYRLAQYTIFLLRNYFPIRDQLYYEEGRLLHEYIAGTPGAKERLLNTVKANAYFEDKYICRQ